MRAQDARLRVFMRVDNRTNFITDRNAVQRHPWHVPVDSYCER